jgi:FKBP-type peptidyl-prolyl cis-trans isomerase SlyD
MRAQIISFNCLVKNKVGHLISSTYNREVLTINDVNPGGVLSGLNKNLQNLKKGEKRVIAVVAEEAYGLYDPRKIILYPRNKLPNTIKKSEQIFIVSKTGVQRGYQVVELHANLARLDGNHPLAGQDLIFEIETLEARDATSQEIDASINTLNQRLLH